MEITQLYQDTESNVRSYCRAVPLEFTKAQGSKMIDRNGVQYLDFLAGCGSLNYGHNDPDMKGALVDYIDSSGPAMGLDFYTSAKTEFLRCFREIILVPKGLNYRVQFTGPTGTNAVEAALKLARKYTGRQNVISFTNGFHGCSLGSLAVTANSANRNGSAGNLHNVHRAFYDQYLGSDLDTAQVLDTLLSDPSGGIEPVAAIILEMLQGEGGLNYASAHWAKKIAQIAKKHGALLIIDDIQAGCGRSGEFFSFEEFGISPDIITMAKSISGFGLPMSLVLISPKIDVWSPGEHNGTFRGNSHAFVTGAVSLKKFWTNDHLKVNVKRKSVELSERLNAIAELHGLQQRGRGFMQGLGFPDAAQAEVVCQRCLSNGLILETCGPRSEVVKLLMPLTTTDEEIDQGIGILSRAVGDVMDVPKHSKIEETYSEAV